LPGFSSALRIYIQGLSSTITTVVDSRKKDREIDPIVYVYDVSFYDIHPGQRRRWVDMTPRGPGMITNGGWVMNISSLANMP